MMKITRKDIEDTLKAVEKDIENRREMFKSHRNREGDMLAQESLATVSLVRQAFKNRGILE